MTDDVFLAQMFDCVSQYVMKQRVYGAAPGRSGDLHAEIFLLYLLQVWNHWDV